MLAARLYLNCYSPKIFLFVFALFHYIPVCMCISFADLCDAKAAPFICPSSHPSACSTRDDAASSHPSACSTRDDAAYLSNESKKHLELHVTCVT